MFLQPGAYLGSYRILAEVGHGGMATVYKAYHAPTDRYVAIKVLPPHFASDEKFTRRFLNEARLIASLEHSHIVPVHDYGEENGLPYIVMRYLQAGTLKEIMARSALPLADITHIVSQIGGALDYAHRQNVIHRDVKPSNILIDHESDCYLADFGIARIVEDAVEYTATGMIGTPAYKSPEQAEGKGADARADIYSMGVVLYEMVTGRIPFQAETPVALVHKHINAPVPLPSEFNPDIPEAVEQVVMIALQKNPDNRYQRMSELVSGLQAAAGAEWTPTSRATTAADVAYQIAAEHIHTAVTIDSLPDDVAQVPVVQPRRAKGLPWWGVIGAVAGVAVIAVGALLLGGMIGPKAGQAGLTGGATSTPMQAAMLEVAATPTPTEMPTLTIMPTPSPTIDSATALALSGVDSNEQWKPYMPYIREFDGVEMVLVPAGCFMMGSDGYADEQPVHQQCLERPFWIDRYEVTNAQFRGFGGQAASESLWTDDNRSRERITWFEAKAFCELRGTRLPTEAEWEYAARGPDGLAYPWGDTFVVDNVVYADNSGGFAWEVGSKPGGASWVGALDMSGNVWEWVSSIDMPYPYDATDGREYSSDTSSLRVLRGGSWYSGGYMVRAAYRDKYAPTFRVSTSGFRCARDY